VEGFDLIAGDPGNFVGGGPHFQFFEDGQAENLNGVEFQGPRGRRRGGLGQQHSRGRQGDPGKDGEKKGGGQSQCGGHKTEFIDKVWIVQCMQ
jgi:hypothetical protein